VLIEIINRMITKNITLEFASLRVHDIETNEEYERNRLFLKPYFKRFKVV